MQSIALSADQPLDPEQVLPVHPEPHAGRGTEHPALQGHPVVKDDPQRFVFQGVHMMLDGDHQRPWKDDEKRQSRLVFIGRNLPEEKIRKGFESCVAQ